MDVLSDNLGMDKVINDKYRKARGGSSKHLNIACSYCGAHILEYQKDGAGSLKRLYLDRILSPEKLRQYQLLSSSDIPNLRCSDCESHIGSPYIYEKENRKAYILNKGSFTKKLIK